MLVTKQSVATCRPQVSVVRPQHHRRVVCLAQSQPSATTVEPQAQPVIEVTSTSPSGSTSFSISSGEEILRSALIANKIDLYNTWGKVMNCGGAGNCGTCSVQVLEGAELLSERTAAEKKKLKGKPESYRLACQAVCGDGENAGKLAVVTQPK